MTTASAPRDAHRALLADFDARRPAALARAVSIVENHRSGFEDLLGALHTRLGRARRIGITGPPGAGKSTITTRLAALYRTAGLSAGIIAVDPTSPFTGGALLGDRIRMEAVALDDGIFIRSMATRGSLGGLAAGTREVADVLDGYGFDRILIETVGVGQSELDIARTADTTAVVLVPESGDSVQAMKAGLMEIADVFVVNKADRPDAERLRHEIEMTLGLRLGGASTMRNVPAHHGVDLKKLRNPAHAARQAAHDDAGDGWTPPVLATIADRGEGIDALAAALDRHFEYLSRSGTLEIRRRERLRERVVEAVERRLRQRLWGDPAITAWVDEQLPALEAGTTTPFVVADTLLARNASRLTQ
ncbi:MAG TPA: methylmalonyl Co-A mutase-associated GTPase MeaB [Gemmatimonadaceae bacterium]|nr:methylmalonyl Co-A mutase-associated GTPase MeaB [Gemmatimonadaceae bacterium]